MRKMLALLAVLTLVSAASAHVVDYWLEDEGAGNFKVWASTSDGDNEGLASFDVYFTGTSIDASQPVNTGPAAYYAPNYVAGQGGFIVFRSGTGAVPFTPLSAAQDTPGTGEVWKGVGNSIVDFSTSGATYRYPASGISGQTRTHHVKSGFSYQVELGDGTYTGTCPGLDPNQTDFTVLISGETNPVYPTTKNALSTIPEPATLGLLALGGLLLLRRRR